MSDVINLAKELRKELDTYPLIEEYQRYKELVNNDPEFQKMRKDIALNKDDPIKHKALLEQYNIHPLVANYNSLREEVKSLYQEICEIINKK